MKKKVIDHVINSIWADKLKTLCNCIILLDINFGWLLIASAYISWLPFYSSMRMLIACILFLNAFTQNVNEHAEATEENL